MTTIDDPTLDYWADVFMANGSGASMTFAQFMTLSVPMRERRIAQWNMQRSMEQKLPDATWRGHALIDPFHHGIRKFRRSWFHNNRNHI